LVREREPVPPSRLTARWTATWNDLPDVPGEGPAKALRGGGERGEDLERWLSGDSIRARPISERSRAWRWCRRHPGLAGAVALSVAALLALAVVSTLYAVHAHDTAEDLRAQQGRTQQALGDVANSARPGRGAYSAWRKLRLAENYLDRAVASRRPGKGRGPWPALG